MQDNHKDFQFSIEYEAKPDVLELILQTKFGTEGGLRYRHCNMEERIGDLDQPEFLVLRKDRRAVGASVYNKRSIHFQGQTYIGYYIRYFTVAPGMRSQGIGTSLMSHAEKFYRATIKEPAIFYGFIEMQNIRSQRVSKTYHLSRIGRFKTLFFSRLFPKKNPYVQRISEEDKSQFKEQLDRQYRNHSLVDFKRIFHNNNTYIFKKEGKILAGAQVNIVRWVFEHVPGFSGWLLMNIVPHLPILGRLSKPGNYRFTTLEGLVLRPGQEAALLAVFEHVLSVHGTFTGMTWLDTRSPILACLKKHGKLGLLHRVQKSLPAAIVASFINVPQAEQETIRAAPVYISAFDLT